MSEMKKSLSAAILCLLLISLFVGLQAVKLTNANFGYIPKKPNVYVKSPLNMSYSTSSLLLTVQMVTDQNFQHSPCTITYSLDDNNNETIFNGTEDDNTDYSVELNGLSEGQHFIKVYGLAIYWNGMFKEIGTATVAFTIESPTIDELPIFGIGICIGTPSIPIPSPNLTLTPTPTPSLSPSPTPSQTTPPTEFTASLSESASALNYGNTINFTVSTNGGVSPYNYTWYVDGLAAASTSLPYYSQNSSVGSHHVYVEVKDANGNSATTLTVEFNVLPNASPSYSPTQSPTAEPTQTNSPREPILNNTTILFIFGSAVLVVTAGTIVLLRERKKRI